MLLSGFFTPFCSKMSSDRKLPALCFKQTPERKPRGILFTVKDSVGAFPNDQGPKYAHAILCGNSYNVYNG